MKEAKKLLNWTQVAKSLGLSKNQFRCDRVPVGKRKFVRDLIDAVKKVYEKHDIEL